MIVALLLRQIELRVGFGALSSQRMRGVKYQKLCISKRSTLPVQFEILFHSRLQFDSLKCFRVHFL